MRGRIRKNGSHVYIGLPSPRDFSSDSLLLTIYPLPASSCCVERCVNLRHASCTLCPTQNDFQPISERPSMCAHIRHCAQKDTILPVAAHVLHYSLSKNYAQKCRVRMAPLERLRPMSHSSSWYLHKRESCSGPPLKTIILGNRMKTKNAKKNSLHRLM